MLLDLPVGPAEIARTATVSKQAASEWRQGTKSPGPVSRAALWNAYGIPAFTWARQPSGAELEPDDDSEPPLGVAPGNDNDDSPPTAAIGSDAISGTDALIAKLRKTSAAADLLPADQIRLADSEAKLLALRHRMLRDQELLEDKIVRDHPAWQRIRRTLAEVLAKHPQAAADVAEALQRLDLGNLT